MIDLQPQIGTVWVLAVHISLKASSQKLMNLEWLLKIWMVTLESRITLLMRRNSLSLLSLLMNPPEAVYAALIITWPMAHASVRTSSAEESSFCD